MPLQAVKECSPNNVIAVLTISTRRRTNGRLDMVTTGE
jgi:hypothetical protein